MATFAQFERRLIGQRTKDALAVRKGQGVKLGRPRVLEDEVVARIRAERAEGRSLRAIATGLNDDSVPTAHGGAAWHASTVSGVLKVAEDLRVLEHRRWGDKVARPNARAPR
jgi:DNA invertase Pin-like site-specific DNA recombinase